MGFRGRVFRAIQRSPAVAEAARRLARVRPARKAGTIWTAKPFSMMGYRRLSRLYDLAYGLERNGVVGSFVECGVRNGGSSAVIASAVRENRDRRVWLFDSWDGLPEPSTADFSLRSGRQGEKGMLPSSIDTVRHLMFATLNLDQSRIHLVQGWFEETIPPIATDLAPIAFLVLDCSWYESYRFCLNELYDRVAKGGIVWLDGYGSWHGCRQAVDEFIAQRQLNATLHPVLEDDAGVYMAVYLHKP
jgi:O-methyltransferase